MHADRQHSPRRVALGKWAGAWLGTGAWFADQQIVSTVVYANCPARTEWLAIAVGVLTALIALFGGWVSWRVRRELPPRSDNRSIMADRFVATASVALACMGILVIVFATTAGLIFRCER